MKLVKQTTVAKPNQVPDEFELQVDNDLVNIFTALKGRIRFGTGTNGDRGENISGEFQNFTSDASANTEFSVTHTLGAVPIGAIVLWQDKSGSLYQGPTTGTNWTSTTIYFKSAGTSVNYLVFLLK
jgi:hypothetical protein